MKILLITWACDRDDVSEPQIAYRWVREISKHHEVVLFSVSKPERHGCVREQFSNLKVIEWKDIKVPRKLERFRAIAKPGYFLYFKKARKLIKDLISKEHFDIIHHLNPFTWRYASPAYGLGVPLIRGPLAGGLQTPAPMLNEMNDVFHPYKFLRHTDKLRKRLDLTLRRSFKETDCVLAAAPYVINLLKPLPIKKIDVEIEHGLKKMLPMHWPGKGIPKDSVVKLLFVGRVIRTKGVQDAIRAISHMQMKTGSLSLLSGTVKIWLIAAD